ncbi:MAG TPA: hypothetical protein PLX89_14950, partial [Verrucomicrobiota bacterium]|nr:hypothetical protein [Verrucomicrobiota bacterium]
MALSALEEGPFLGRLLGLPQASAALNEEPAPYRTSAPTPPQGATVDVPTTGQPGLELRTVVSVLQKGLP